MIKWMVVLCIACSVTLKAEVNVLAFSGSTRGGSYNQKLVVEAANIAREMHAVVTVVNLKDYPVPFYDEDLEKSQGMPPNAKQLQQLMLRSQVILIASPEYNGTLSGVLKNTIDWMSRGETGGGSRDAFKEKKFVIMSTSLGSGGGARGLVHLRSIIENIGGTVIPDTLAVPHAHEAFTEQGQLKDPKLKKQLEHMVQAALNE